MLCSKASLHGGRLLAVLLCCHFALTWAVQAYRVSQGFNPTDYFNGSASIIAPLLRGMATYLFLALPLALATKGLAREFPKASWTKLSCEFWVMLLFALVAVGYSLVNCVMSSGSPSSYRWLGARTLVYGGACGLLLILQRPGARGLEWILKTIPIFLGIIAFGLLPLLERYAPHEIYPYVHWRSRHRILNSLVYAAKVGEPFQDFLETLPEKKLKNYPNMVVIFHPLDTSCRGAILIVRDGILVALQTQEGFSPSINLDEFKKYGFILSQDDLFYAWEGRWAHGVFIQEFP